MENSRLFSQDPQHTATHSDGVTQTSTTEPPLSEAEHTARRGPQLLEQTCIRVAGGKFRGVLCSGAVATMYIPFSQLTSSGHRDLSKSESRFKWSEAPRDPALAEQLLPAGDYYFSRG
eukprot:superscaffoldBa00000003_g79